MIFNPSSRKGTAKVNHFFEFAKFILKIFCIMAIIFPNPPHFRLLRPPRSATKTRSHCAGMVLTDRPGQQAGEMVNTRQVCSICCEVELLDDKSVTYLYSP